MVNGQVHASAALTPRKQLTISIEQEGGCASEPVWTVWRRYKGLPVPGIAPRLLGRLARLRYPCSEEERRRENNKLRIDW